MFKIKLKMIHKWTNKYIRIALKNGDLVTNEDSLVVSVNNRVISMTLEEFIKTYIDYDISKLGEILDKEGIKLISELRKTYSGYAVSKWNSCIAIMISIISTIVCEVFFKLI